MQEKGVNMDIRCRKTLCKFNNRYTCTAKEIVVKKNGECDKFEKDENKNVVDKTQKIFTDNPPEYAPQRDSLTIDIKCRACCLFNDCGQCEANGITLNDLQSKAICITFLKK